MSEKTKNILFKIIIFLGLAILISIPYINAKAIFGHDISYHLNRIVSIKEELELGNFPVLMHSNLNEGFGYANPLFYPEIFLYIPAIICMIGANCFVAYKVFIFLINLATILITYYSANIIFKNRKIVWITTLLYTVAFYRLSDIYIRGAIGEVLALTFLPLVLSGLYEIIFGDNKKWWIVCFGIFGVINSHVLTFFMAIILIIIICLFNVVRIFKEKRFKNLIIAGIVSLLLSLSFALPYLEQASKNKYNVNEYTNIVIQDTGESLKEMLNISFSSKDAYKSVGLIIILGALTSLFSNKKENQNYYIKQLLFIGIILIICSSNKMPWNKLCAKIHAISTIQFVYRLNIITTVLLTYCAGYGIYNLFENKKKLLVFIVGVVIILQYSLMIFTLDINEPNYSAEEAFYLSPTGNSEYLPLGTKFKDKTVRNINSETPIKFTRIGSKIEFLYEDSENPMVIHIPLVYYKGYKAYIESEDGTKTELFISQDEYSKNIHLNSDEIITGKVTIEYKMTIIQKFSYIVTYTALILLIIYICVSREDFIFKGVKQKKLDIPNKIKNSEM